MTRFQKALGILLSLCFFTILTIVPEPVFTGKNVYRHLPLYRFLEKKSREIDQYGDQKTYEAIASENGKYLRQKAKEEQTSISEKEKKKNSKSKKKQKTKKQKTKKTEKKDTSRETISTAVPDPAIDLSPDLLADYDYLLGQFYIVDSNTETNPAQLNAQDFLKQDFKISKDTDVPQILIYHSHSQETFADSVAGDPTTTIVGVGDYLTELLTQKYGYQVIHDTSVYDYVDGKLDRSKAYTYAEEGIAKILQENPSIEVVIDLHRDGVAETTHLLTEVDGKKMAKIMFFNGLSYSRVNGDIGYLYNPYRDDNLAMSLQMQLIGKAYYPDFLRNIYVNAYRYCLHERGRSMLIEAGAQTNTVEEVKNAMEPLADILNKFLSGEKVYE